MSKFELDLTAYDVELLVPAPTEQEPHAMGTKMSPYPIRNNLSTWLRGPGIFRSAEDVAEAIYLAKSIRDELADMLILDEREADVLKKCINRVVELTADGQATVGGPTHEEVICRVMRMREVK